MSERVPNLMSALFQWAHRQDENFTTEALVWTLRTVLAHESNEGLKFVSWLCFGQNDEVKLDVTIRTQHTIDEGRPDISVVAPGIFVFIEVKTASPLARGQVDRYLTGLAAQRMDRRGALVLLTRDAPELTSEQEKSVRCVRWHEVATRLRRARFGSAEAKAAIEMLLGFLKEQIMTVEQVDWEYSRGVTALRRLLVMLDVALPQAGIRQYVKANAWDYVGYYLDGMRYWAGIRYNAPHLLVVGYYRAKPDLDCIKKSGLDFRDAHYGPELVLDLTSDEVHFHSRDAISQLERLTQFVRDAYPALKTCDGSQSVTAEPAESSAPGMTLDREGSKP